MNKKSAPAYSMPGKPKAQSSLQVPGPGAYSSQTESYRQSSPAHKMAVARRDTDYSNDTPGPGNYTIDKNIQHGINVVIIQKHKDPDQPNLPGPGAYKPNFEAVKKKMPKWVLKDRIRKELNQSQKMPGPGDYNPNNTYKSSSNVLFGHSDRLDRRVLTESTPGPGSYNTQTAKKLGESDKEISFSKALRSTTVISNMPGPGEYKLKTDLETSTEKQKGYQIGARVKCSTEAGDIPGPGTYNTFGVNSRIKKSPSYSLQKATKTIEYNDQKPAPGDYNIQYSSLKRIGGTITRSERVKEDKEKATIPGPGTYNRTDNKNPGMTRSGKQYSFTRSRLSDKRQETPGPQYNPKPVYETKYSSISLGYANRGSAFQSNSNPGPGSYGGNYDTISSFKSKGGYKIGQEQRSHDRNSKSPGPGQYNLPSYISNLPSFANSKTFGVK